MSTVEPSTPPHAPNPHRAEAQPCPDSSIPDEHVTGFLVTDPVLARSLKSDRERSNGSSRDEVWDGVYVMSPAPDLEHQWIGQELWLVFRELLKQLGGGTAYNVLNVSDRVEGWVENFREPDVAVYSALNPAIRCGTHMCGGPDLAVEILSRNDPARHKLDFYSKVHTLELWILDRDPWKLELYRLEQGRLQLAGISSVESDERLLSRVLPVEVALIAGDDRPWIELRTTCGGAVWRV